MKTHEEYMNGVHIAGRVWVLAALAVLLGAPAAICAYYGAWPVWGEFIRGFMAVAPVFWTVAFIEVFTYVPMLGAGGSYLGFVTGNITSLKVPCALNAMNAVGVKPGTEEGELISTIAIASSSITTITIIALGVLLLAPLRPVLESPVLAPAFAQILPALFGGLGVALISRSWKIAVLPIACMFIIFLAVPSLASAVAVLVPVGVAIALIGAWFMYKRGLV